MKRNSKKEIGFLLTIVWVSLHKRIKTLTGFLAFLGRFSARKTIGAITAGNANNLALLGLPIAFISERPIKGTSKNLALR